MKQNETGRSMVEMLGVLAIISVISMGAISAIGFGIESVRIGTAINAIETTASNVADLYSWSRKYPTTAEAASAKTKICSNRVFEGECIDDATAPCTGAATTSVAWGHLCIQPDESGAKMKLYLTNVPKSACERLSINPWVNVIMQSTECSDDSTTLEFSIE